MARKKFEEGFKENAIEYCQIHSDKTIKACAADLGIGYSTLRRWIAQSEEQSQEENASVEAIEAIVEANKEEAASTEEVVPLEVETPVAEEVVCKDSVLELEKDTDVEARSEEDAPIVEVEDSYCDETIDSAALDFPAEALQEELDEEFDWLNKRDQVKSQLGGFIESAGNGVSDAVQLIGLYKKRHDLKKVQKKLRKEKEKRMKQ